MARGLLKRIKKPVRMGPDDYMLPYGPSIETSNELSPRTERFIEPRPSYRIFMLSRPLHSFISVVAVAH